MAWVARRLPGLALASLILTVCGLVRIDYLACSVIYSGWPQYVSDYVQARGFPFAWMIIDNHLCAASLPWWQRFLAARFSMSYFATLLFVLAVAGIGRAIALSLHRSRR